MPRARHVYRNRRSVEAMSTTRKKSAGTAAKAPRAKPPGELALSPSERMILNIVRRHDEIARAPTAAATPKGPGQPSPRIELVREAACSVGISINTDSITLCLADLGCRVLEE